MKFMHLQIFDCLQIFPFTQFMLYAFYAAGLSAAFAVCMAMGFAYSILLS